MQKISKHEISELKAENLGFINASVYSLYKSTHPNYPEIAYTLRAGAKNIYFLTENGTVIEYGETVYLEELKIGEQVKIEDIIDSYIITAGDRYFNLGEKVNYNE